MSPLPVGSVSSQSTSASAALVRVRLQLPWPSPVSGSPTWSQSEPFDFRWLTTAVNRAPLALTSNVWAIDGRLRVSMNLGSTVESMIACAPDRRHPVRLVEDAHADRVRADDAGVDEVVGAGTPRPR